MNHSTLNNRLLFLAMTALTLLPGCKKEKEAVAEPPIRVNVEVVGAGSSQQGREYSGTVEAASTTTVSFAVPGTITQLTLDEGQKVAKGQLLGKVRNADYINADNIAQAELAEARDAYERMKKLHDANALPEIKWVEIQQKLKQAENAAQMASRTLGDASLYSPVSGVVSRKLANVGQNVISAEPIYEIMSTNRLTLDISVTEEEIGNISVGDPALISFENIGLENIASRVSSKSYSADPLTRSYTVKLELPADGKILAGMLGNVVLEQRKEPADTMAAMVISLPVRAVLLDSDNRNFVWVVKDGKAQRKFVEADELVSNGVAVKSGLQRGDSVIVDGMRKVSTGSIVDVVNQ